MNQQQDMARTIQWTIILLLFPASVGAFLLVEPREIGYMLLVATAVLAAQTAIHEFVEGSGWPFACKHPALFRAALALAGAVVAFSAFRLT